MYIFVYFHEYFSMFVQFEASVLCVFIFVVFIISIIVLLFIYF